MRLKDCFQEALDDQTTDKFLLTNHGAETDFFLLVGRKAIHLFQRIGQNAWRSAGSAPLYTATPEMVAMLFPLDCSPEEEWEIMEF